MTISKKITLGALILLAGVLFLPMKTWAANPTVTVTVDNSTMAGAISYTVSEYDGGDYTLVLDGSATGEYPVASNGTTSISADAISYFGYSSITDDTNYTLTAELYSGTSKSSGTKISDVTVVNGSGTVYVGKAVAASGTTHAKCNGYTLTTSPIVISRCIKADYMVSITLSVEAPYYITQAGAYSINAKSRMIGLYANEIGTLEVSENRMSASLSKPTVNSVNYTTNAITFNPDMDLSSLYVYVDPRIDTSSGSGTLSITSCTFDKSTKKITLAISGTGSYLNAYFDVFVSDSALSGPPYNVDYKIASLEFAINVVDPKVPTGITINAGPSAVLNGETETYTATLSPSGAVGTIKWRITSGGSYASIDENTGELTAGASVGDVKIQAYVDGTPIVSTEKDVHISKITDVKIDTSCPTAIVAKSGRTAQYSAKVYYDTGLAKSEDSGVKWAITEGTSYASISDSGLLTLNSTAESNIGQKIKIQATSKKDTAVKSEEFVITLTSIIPVTGIDFVTKAVTKNFVLDMSVNKNVKISPSTAVDSIDYITWSSSDTDKGEITSTYTYKGHNAGFKGLKEGITTLTPTIYYVNGTYETLSGTSFKVYNPVTVENFDSNDGLKFTLPDAVYRSYSDDKNISEVTGYRIDVLNKDGNSVYNSTTSTNSKSITLSGDTVENLIENATGNLSGDTHQVKLMISPVGKSQTNSGSTVTNSEENVRGISDTRTAYKVSVSGSNIKSASIYGLANHSVKITATPTSSTYKFAGWSDGNTSNPRTVTVSTNTSSNSYTATANTTGTPTSNAGNSSGGSKGSNSKLDKVPKTGESMAIYFIVMIAVISGCVAFATLFKSLTAKAAKSGYEGSIDSWRGGEDGTGESHKK